VRVREAAEMLGISERLLARLTKNGEVPIVRLGTAVVYPVAGLEEWLAVNTVCKGSPRVILLS
jgi:excisionase family DNA binding protein